MKKSSLGLFALAAVLIGGVSLNAAYADNDHHGWFRHHHRAEVLKRDNRLGREIREDKGHLGGHYGQLMARDRYIKAQERRMLSDGHLSKSERLRLNREENRLSRAVHRNDHGH